MTRTAKFGIWLCATGIIDVMEGMAKNREWQNQFGCLQLLAALILLMLPEDGKGESK